MSACDDPPVGSVDGRRLDRDLVHRCVIIACAVHSRCGCLMERRIFWTVISHEDSARLDAAIEALPTAHRTRVFRALESGVIVAVSDSDMRL